MALPKKKIEKLSDVFRTTGQPEITYVERDSGNLERRLEGYLDERGQLCLITGPSKTGKSTLYKRVLTRRKQEPLVVQCTAGKTCEQIWTSALEQVNFERVIQKTEDTSSEVQISSEVGAKFGWSWLAEVTGKLTASAKEKSSEAEIRQRFLADASPEHLIPILQNTRYVLIIEDFHYLDDKEKVLLFQQWKRFVDNEVTIIVLGTSHRAVDIANSNKDLVGRIAQIDVKQWDTSDLQKICEQGFEYLDIPQKSHPFKKICVESVGLPIIVQQVCLQLFNRNNVFSIVDAKKSTLDPLQDDNINSSFSDVANEKYAQFESYYNTLIRGPREKSRKYKTYELIVACFAADPITFCLSRSQIDERLSKLEIEQGEKPPAASLNSTLGALGKFQEKREFQLLEWLPGQDNLYVVEPSFLFYVRWRTRKTDRSGLQLDLFSSMLDDIYKKNEEIRLRLAKFS